MSRAPFDTETEARFVRLEALVGVAPAANVADMTGSLTGTVDGAMVNVAATASAVAGGSGPTAAQVDTGIALAVSTIVSGVNEQNKELLTKLNALLDSLRAAGIIA